MLTRRENITAMVMPVVKGVDPPEAKPEQLAIMVDPDRRLLVSINSKGEVISEIALDWVKNIEIGTFKGEPTLIVTDSFGS